MSNIVSWAGVLQRKYTGADQQLKRGLGVIVDNAMVQSQIIADLVDMSRIVAGKVTLELKPIDLAEITAHAVNAQRPAAELKGIALDLELEHEGSVVVLADATRLQSIMDRSAVNVRERAGAYRQGGWQAFNVKETPYTADQVRKERELYMQR